MKKIALAVLLSIGSVIHLYSQDSLYLGLVASPLIQLNLTSYPVEMAPGLLRGKETTQSASLGFTVAWFPQKFNGEELKNAIEISYVLGIKKLTAVADYNDPTRGSTVNESNDFLHRNNYFSVGYRRHQYFREKLAIVYGADAVALAYVKTEMNFSKRETFSGNNLMNTSHQTLYPKGYSTGISLLLGAHYKLLNKLSLGISAMAGGFYTRVKGEMTENFQSVTVSGNNTGLNVATIKTPMEKNIFTLGPIIPQIHVRFNFGLFY